MSARLRFILAIFSAAAAASDAHAGTIFTRVFERGEGPLVIGSFESRPVLNDAGQVAFIGRRNDGVREVVRVDDGQVTRIASAATSSLHSFGEYVAINNSGQVAFRGINESGTYNGVFRGDGAALTTIADTAAGFTSFISPNYPSGPSINDRGQVAFFGWKAGPMNGIYVGSGGSVSTIAEASTGPGSAGYVGVASISNAGHVAYTAILNPEPGRILVDRGAGPPAVIAETRNVLGGYSSLGVSQLNNFGSVAFAAPQNAPVPNYWTLNLASGGQITTSLPGGAITGYPDQTGVAINDGNTVAAIAGLSDGGYGIVIDSGEILIRYGDQLDGSTVIGFGFVNGGLNLLGQVAFVAALADGRVGIYRADRSGSSQDNALTATAAIPGGFLFEDVPTGLWFDPPLVDAFDFAMTSQGSLFTEILGFPTGFVSPFTVSVGGQVLGTFAPGQSLDFRDFYAGGVRSFRISGIGPLVDPGAPGAFPIRLAFSSPRASFTMTGVAAVPEPSSLLLMGMGGLASIATFVRRRRSRRGG